MKNINILLLVSILLITTSCDNSIRVKGSVSYYKVDEDGDTIADDNAQIFITNDFESCEIIDNYLKPAHAFSRIRAYEYMIKLSKNLIKETKDNNTIKELKKQIREMDKEADNEADLFRSYVSSWEDYEKKGKLAFVALQKIKTHNNYNSSTDINGNFEINNLITGKFIMFIISGYTTLENDIEKEGTIMMDKLILKSGDKFFNDYKFEDDYMYK